MQVWLLSFSNLGPSMTVEQWCLVGGLQLDECYAVTGLSHHFCLLKFVSGLELDAMKRLLQRVTSLLGVIPASAPVSGDICKHCAVRLMVDRKGVVTWMRHGVVSECGLIDYYIRCLGNRRGKRKLDNVQATRHCLLQSLANVRRNMLVHECRNVFKKEMGRLSVEGVRKFDSSGRRADQKYAASDGLKQCSALPYQYFPEVRPNDDKWTSGWA